MFIDNPDERSVHEYPTPSAGGLSIIAAFALYLISLTIFYPAKNISYIILLISVIPVVAIGVIDDLKKIGIYKRLLVHVFSSLVIVYYFQISNNSSNIDFQGQSPYIITIFSIFLSVWLMNLYNFMDGIDQLAISQAIFFIIAVETIVDPIAISICIY